MLILKNKPASLTMIFLLSTSFFGLMLAIFFVANPHQAQDNFAFRKPAVGTALAVVCVIGVLAVLYPEGCAGIAGLKRRYENMHDSNASHGWVLHGHHFNCEPYSTHIIRVGNRIFCATCTGLLVGAIIVLVCVGLFFFGDISISEKSFVPVLVGAVCVAVGLLYAVVPAKFQNGVTRFFAGALLPSGSFLVLAGVEEAAKSLSIDLFIVVLSVLWLSTKMALSQWEHRRICAGCALSVCAAESAA